MLAELVVDALAMAVEQRRPANPVARLPRELGVDGVTRRRFRTGTTKRGPKARPARDLVRRVNPDD